MYMDRRDFMRTAGGFAGGTAAVGAAGTAAAQDGETPDFGGYTEGAAGGSYEDLRGNDSVTIEVGAGSSGLAFGPTEVWIDSGTEVTFEWVSNGHNVVVENQPEGANWGGSEGGAAELYSEGHTFSFTFETGGIYHYYCSPHEQSGMLGAIAVGSDVPTQGGGGGATPTPVNPEHMGVPFHPHFVGIATLVMMVVSILFSFFVLKYGESPHASGGND